MGIRFNSPISPGISGGHNINVGIITYKDCYMPNDRITPELAKRTLEYSYEELGAEPPFIGMPKLISDNDGAYKGCDIGEEGCFCECEPVRITNMEFWTDIWLSSGYTTPHPITFPVSVRFVSSSDNYDEVTETLTDSMNKFTQFITDVSETFIFVGKDITFKDQPVLSDSKCWRRCYDAYDENRIVGFIPEDKQVLHQAPINMLTAFYYVTLPHSELYDYQKTAWDYQESQSEEKNSTIITYIPFIDLCMNDGAVLHSFHYETEVPLEMGRDVEFEGSRIGREYLIEKGYGRVNQRQKVYKE